jgi:hypothetical protein
VRRLASLLLGLVILGGALCAAPKQARAHSWTVAHSDVLVADDRASAEYRLRIHQADLGALLGLGERGATAADVAAGTQRLFEQVTRAIELSGDGAPCVPRLLAVGVIDPFAEIRWHCAWPRPIALFVIDYDLFFAIDPHHTGVLVVTHRGERASFPLRADQPVFEWALAESPPAGVGGWVRLGVHHIFTGYDHVGFLMGLLLCAVVSGRGGATRPRGLGAGIRYTLVIVSSFTVAHSATLIVAALGWLSLPTRLVESAIAASIIFVCVENLLRPDPPRRWLLTFAFGLVHGLGFAASLRPSLPATGVVIPLLAFNVGVEVGQLVVVALVFPVLHAIAARIGVTAYRRVLVAGGSSAVGLMGVFWLIQRTLGW